MKSVIKIENVSKNYKSFEAVKNVNLEIFEGELFGLIGPNGAGKTTMFKMLLGLLKPTHGKIYYGGKDLYNKWSRDLQSEIGYLPENVVFYDHLTGLESLEYFGKLKGVDSNRVKEVIEILDIAHYINRNVKDYSKGMRQRIGLAQSILGRPKILFLDEPTTGLDPQGVADFFDILFKLKKSGTTIIMTSHILREIQDRVDRLGVMLDGKLHAVGNIAQLKEGLDLEHGVVITTKENNVKIIDHLKKINLDVFEKSKSSVLAKFKEGQKLEVLEHIMNLKEEIKDIDMFSPGLDDVFLSLVKKGNI